MSSRLTQLKRGASAVSIPLAMAISSCAPMFSQVPAENPDQYGKGRVLSEFSNRRNVYAILINGGPDQELNASIENAKDALQAWGVPKDRVLSASFSDGTASEASLVKTLDKLAGEITSEDLLVVYVGGHGYESGFKLQNDETISHERFISLFERFKKIPSVFIIGACYGDRAVNQIIDAGFSAIAMSPEERGLTISKFGEFFWATVKEGVDLDGDGNSSMRESFLRALDKYNIAKFGCVSGDVTPGTFRTAFLPLTDRAELDVGNIVLFIRSPSGASPSQKANLEKLDEFSGASLKVMVSDSSSGLLPEGIPARAAEAWKESGAAIIFLKGGKVMKAISGNADFATLVQGAKESFGIRYPKLEYGTEATRRVVRNRMYSEQALGSYHDGISDYQDSVRLIHHSETGSAIHQEESGSARLEINKKAVPAISIRAPVRIPLSGNGYFSDALRLGIGFELLALRYRVHQTGPSTGDKPDSSGAGEVGIAGFMVRPSLSYFTTGNGGGSTTSTEIGFRGSVSGYSISAPGLSGSFDNFGWQPSAFFQLSNRKSPEGYSLLRFENIGGEGIFGKGNASAYSSFSGNWSRTVRTVATPRAISRLGIAGYGGDLKLLEWIGDSAALGFALHCIHSPSNGISTAAGFVDAGVGRDNTMVSLRIGFIREFGGTEFERLPSAPMVWVSVW
ncbi:MAG: hypothetical protein V1861_05185 [Candidatus Micrarchaeota archaeon]